MTVLHELHRIKAEAGMPGARPIWIRIMEFDKNFEADVISKTKASSFETVVMFAVPLQPSTGVKKKRGAMMEMRGYGSKIPVENLREENWAFGENGMDNSKKMESTIAGNVPDLETP
jgi:hypothetical protein